MVLLDNFTWVVFIGKILPRRSATRGSSVGRAVDCRVEADIHRSLVRFRSARIFYPFRSHKSPLSSLSTHIVDSVQTSNTYLVELFERIHMKVPLAGFRNAFIETRKLSYVAMFRGPVE